MRTQNPFTITLRSIVSAVNKTFVSDQEFGEWIYELYMDTLRGCIDQDKSSKIYEMVYNVDLSFLKKILYNETEDEIQAIIAESFWSAISNFGKAKRWDRFNFASLASNLLLNSYIRRLNASARSMGRLVDIGDLAQVPDNPIPHGGADPTGLDASTHRRLNEFVINTLSQRRSKKEVASPETVVRIKDVWLSAIEDVEKTHGSGKAKPFAEEVKTRIAERLNLDRHVVEAGVKRLSRALRALDERYRSDVDDNTNLRAWLVTSSSGSQT